MLGVNKDPGRKPSYYVAIVGLIAWFAIVLQLILTHENVINFFSYFTILSNLLVAVSLTFLLCWPLSAAGTFFSRPSVQSAIALYILIVGLVYNTVLRGIWEPKEWQLLADNLLHVIVPVLYLIYWLFYFPKGVLKYKDGISWIYFPLLYLIYSLIRGSVTGWYPYPFLEVTKLGYDKVFLNVILVIVAFLVTGWFLIVINRWKGKNL